MSDAPPGLPTWLTFLLATACGLIVANIYYAQPLVGPISAELGLSPQAAGLIVTMTQIGYGAGLLLIVPLGDVFENRSLVLASLSLLVLALLGIAVARDSAFFLAASLLVGVSSVSVQVILPYVAHLVPEAVRGRVVGNVLSGLMLGIMLARPVASFVTEATSWRVVFLLSAAVMVGLAVVLRLYLPPRRPAGGLRYATLLASMVRLAWHTKLLQRRSLYQACLFGAFSLFWTTVPLLLADTYHLSQNGIALFALAGVAGAVAAPIAGRAADRGWMRAGTGLAMAAVAASFLLSRVGLSGSGIGLAVLVLAGIMLDFGVTSSFVLGQRAIFALAAEYRSRLNGLFLAAFFLGGAVGSALGGWAYAAGGWSLSSWFGLGLPALALLCFATERRC